MTPPDYRCTVCGKLTPRDELAVKQVRYVTVGAGTRVLKSKNVAWLCPRCREDDEKEEETET